MHDEILSHDFLFTLNYKIFMIEILFWSLLAVTWITVGMHVTKEFIRFNSRKR